MRISEWICNRAAVPSLQPPTLNVLTCCGLACWSTEWEMRGFWTNVDKFKSLFADSCCCYHNKVDILLEWQQILSFTDYDIDPTSSPPRE